MDDVGFQLAELAADAPAGADRGERLLDLFVPVAEASAAVLTRWDPATRRSSVAAVRGYRPELVAHLVSGDFHRADPAYRLLRRERHRPLRCWWDAELDYARSAMARRFLLPVGYRGGVTLRLVSRDGEHVGDLHMSTQAREHPSPSAMRVLHRSLPTIAAIVRDDDPARDPAQVLPLAAHTVLVRPDGGVVGLGGRADPPLHPGSALLAAVRGRTDRTWHWRDERGAWFRVETRSVRGGVVVAAQPVESVRGLSPRELEVLDLLGAGLPNLGIARTLQLSERTVAHHVERILGKLAVTSRAGAAAVAEREGLRLLA